MTEIKAAQLVEQKPSAVQWSEARIQNLENRLLRTEAELAEAQLRLEQLESQSGVLQQEPLITGFHHRSDA